MKSRIFRGSVTFIMRNSMRNIDRLLRRCYAISVFWRARYGADVDHRFASRLAAGAWLAAAAFGGALAGCTPATTPGFHPPSDPAALRSSTATADDLAFAKSADSPVDAQAQQTGLATWYGDRLAGNKTASGEIFDPRRMTAAHRTLKLGTWIEVRRVDTGSTVRVRINDRGPFGKERTRIIDLSRGAAEKIGMVRDGVVRVELRVVPGP